MKTYKLIKWYPGISKNAVKAVQRNKVAYHIIDKNNDMLTLTDADIIEHSPDFWQEIVEFSYTTKDGIHICDGNQIVYGYNTASKATGSVPAKNYSKVDSWLFFSTSEVRQEYINSLEPIPLFTGMDGLPIYPYTAYWGVDIDNYSIKVLSSLGKNENRASNYILFGKFENAENFVLNNKPIFSLEECLKAVNFYDSCILEATKKSIIANLKKEAKIRINL